MFFRFKTTIDKKELTISFDYYPQDNTIIVIEVKTDTGEVITLKDIKEKHKIEYQCYEWLMKQDKNESNNSSKTR